MLLPLPGTVETTIPVQAGRWPALTLVLGTVLTVAVLLPILSWLMADHRWAEGLVRAAGLAEASWTLYPDAALFQPWQPWSWILAGGPWWMGLANVPLAVVLMAAIERRSGSRWLALALLVLVPLGALVHLLASPAAWPVQAGAGALVTGLTGLAWGLLRPTRLTIGLGWWAVVVVGWIPLGAIAMPWLGVLWLALDGGVHGPVALAADALTLVAGALIGNLLRLRIRWAVG